jgi:type II secretory ATPase GspE/PulE/Tfp pilus assembly ATPase PilB-like protein
MLDMGVEPYLVASSLIGAVAQRLVRRVCQSCAAPDMPSLESRKAIGLRDDDWDSANLPFRRGAGCDKCARTGYKGRVGLYELFKMDENLQRMTVERQGSNTLKDYAVKNHGMRTLLGDGKLAVLAGKTTPEEVLRVCQREAF